MAFIALDTRPNGSAETVGVVRPVADPDNVEAEFAIVIRSDLKAQSLGHLLLCKMIRYMKSGGTRRLVGDVLRENQTMRELTRSNGFDVDTTASNGPSLRYVLNLQPENAEAHA